MVAEPDQEVVVEDPGVAEVGGRQDLPGRNVT